MYFPRKPPEAGGFGMDFVQPAGFRIDQAAGIHDKQACGMPGLQLQEIPGKAIDVRLRGMETATLHDIAISLERGGVGYYGKSDFVHVDTGRVRRW